MRNLKKWTTIGILATFGVVPAFARSLQVEVVASRPNMIVYAIGNDAQSTVVGDNQIDSTTTAVAWVPNGSTTAMPGADGMSQAGDVTSNGDVVGWMHSAATGTDTAVIWYADSGYTTWQELGLPPGSPIFATQGFKMNDAGDVVVLAYMTQGVSTTYGPFGVAYDYYRWDPDKRYTILPHLTRRQSYTWDINSAGTVVGYSTDFDGSQVAVSWSRSNKISVLGLPPGATSAEARSINNAGVIVGTMNGTRDGWVWTKKGGFRILPDYGYNAQPLQINGNGIIVGTADVEPWNSAPVVWDADGNLYNLAEILGSEQYYWLEAAPAINDKNQVVAYAYSKETGDMNAVVLQLRFVD